MKLVCRLLLVWLGFFALQSQADTLLVIVPTATALTAEFVAALKRQRDDDNVVVHSLADPPLSAIDPALIITMGLSSLEWRLAQPDRTPTIATYVTRSSLQPALYAALPSYVHIMLANPKPERQLRLAELLLPRLRTLGMLHSSAHAGQIGEWEEAASAAELKLTTAKLTEPGNLARLLARLLDRNDVLIGLDDPVIYNADNLKTILLTSYTRNRVLIGPSAPFIAAGSLSTTFSSPADMARSVDYLFAHTASAPPMDYPRFFSVLSNQQVARSMGFAPPDDSALAAELARMEGTQ